MAKDSKDPIDKLEAHYKGLRAVPTPALQVRPTQVWWEATGGLAAGIVVVLVTASACLSTPKPSSVGGGLLELQLRSAGLVRSEFERPKHAAVGATWHI